MNLTEIAHKARRHHQLGQQIKALETEQEAIGDELVAELARRRRDSLPVEDVTVTRTSRVYDYEAEVLRERLKPAVFRRVTKLKVDAKALRAEIKAGKATDADLQAAAKRSRVYPVVTFVDAA